MSPEHCRWPPRQQLCPSFGILGATEGTATCSHTQVPPSTEQNWPGKSLESSSAAREPQLECLQAGGDGIWEACQSGSPGRPPACPGVTFRVPNREDRTCDRPRHSENRPHPAAAVCPPSAPAPGWCRVTPPASLNALTLCCPGAPVEPACTAPKLGRWTQTAEQPQCLQPHTLASLARRGSCEVGAATHRHSGHAGSGAPALQGAPQTLHWDDPPHPQPAQQEAGLC